jgi:hypothetical protein
MDKQKLKKGNELNSDIKLMSYIISEFRNQHHWVTIKTPNIKESFFSERFEKELIEWMNEKMEEYKKEFEEL